mgnify:CR=1 FL=1
MTCYCDELKAEIRKRIELRNSPLQFRDGEAYHDWMLANERFIKQLQEWDAEAHHEARM